MSMLLTSTPGSQFRREKITLKLELIFITLHPIFDTIYNIVSVHIFNSFSIKSFSLLLSTLHMTKYKGFTGNNACTGRDVEDIRSSCRTELLIVVIWRDNQIE